MKSRKQSPPDSSGGSRQETEERLRAILETAVEAIITIDDRGIIESANPAAARMFGYEEEELVGRNVNMLMPSPDRERHDSYLKRYAETGEARVIGIGRETVARHKDGRTFPIDLAISEVKLPGKTLFTGFVRDISERKRAEVRLAEMARSLESKNKELETVVYVASHDLRSPLVNIQGFSKELTHACQRVKDLLECSPGDTISKDQLRPLLEEEVAESLEFIQAGVAKIDSLLNGFLKFSRLGRAALKIEPLDMDRMMQEILRTMEYQIQQAGAQVSVASLPPCRGDALQVNQVFTNLLDNALKYVRPGVPGRIRVTGEAREGRSIYRVSDNGIGIDPAHQEKIFEIFHRLDPQSGVGEGLGLTIAQRALDRQGGSIEVESSPGCGATFCVSLPSPTKQNAATS